MRPRIVAQIIQPSMYKRGGVGRVWLLLWFCLSLLASFGGPLARAHADEANYSEKSVKAAFIYNFLKFIEFPRRSAAGIRLCLLVDRDDLSFFGALDGKALEQGVVLLRQVQLDSNFEDCDVLFVSILGAPLPALLDRARAARVLTVGEQTDFIRLGGIINFYVENGKVRFEISQLEAEKMGLRISSKLLSLGRLVVQHFE